MAADRFSSPADAQVADVALDVAWQLCLALADWRRTKTTPASAEYKLVTAASGAPSLVEAVPGDPRAVARFQEDAGWQIAPGWPAPALDLINLYWPMLSLPVGRTLTVG